MQVKYLPNNISHYVFPRVKWTRHANGKYTSGPVTKSDHTKRILLVMRLAKTDDVEQHPTMPHIVIAYNKPRRKFHMED